MKLVINNQSIKQSVSQPTNHFLAWHHSDNHLNRQLFGFQHNVITQQVRWTGDQQLSLNPLQVCEQLQSL